MADHNPQHGRRPHFHRGRRGPDRRGIDRRGPQREPPADPAARDGAREGNVDVEQIMREIRARIAQRHGIELSTQQIQELAARRLEAILEPRHLKPQLLEQLRRSAGAAPEIPSSASIETYEFEDTTIYDTHRGILRFFRKLLNPLLKLLFNPTPLINALHTQVRINKELAARELERERRQSEWNALQYELVQRVVLEISRVTLEMQALSGHIESLSTKVDFNERRVRGLETTTPVSQPRQQPRHQEPAPTPPPPAAAAAAADSTSATEAGGEVGRRRRRRRRGRRSGAGPAESQVATGSAVAAEDDEPIDLVEGDDEEVADAEVEATETPNIAGTLPEPMEPTSSSPVPIEPAEQATPPPSPIPSAPRDEPTPENPVDHADPGPVDR